MKWLLTVIAKADLWWGERQSVYDHYQRGSYYGALGTALQQFGPLAMHHCSVFHKFYGRSPMSGLFDDNDRVQARSNLLGALVRLAANAE